MAKQPGSARIKNWMTILIWVGVLVFFVYSHQTIMDWEQLAHPNRQSQFIRILTAYAQPNLFDYEYEVWETPVALEESCKNTTDAITQTSRVDDRTIVIALECPRERRTIYAVQGSGFQPDTAGYVVWKTNIDTENRKFAGSDFLTDNEGNFTITFVHIDLENVTSERTIIVIEQLNRIIQGFSETSRDAVKKMWETIQMAFLATSMSALLAIPFALFSARASSFWGRGVTFLVQLMSAAIRSIHPLLTVIPTVVIAGLGPTAGVLALTVFSTAVLITNFSEYAQQNPDLSWADLLKIHLPALAFRYLPVNTLLATIIGFMGGGGIGFILQQNMNLLNYRDVGVYILAIIVAISSLDLLSRAVWRKLQVASETEKEAILSRI